MKVNIKNIDYTFWERVSKHAFNSEKINFDIKSDRFAKTFHFWDIYLSSKMLSSFSILYLHGLQFGFGCVCKKISLVSV